MVKARVLVVELDPKRREPQPELAAKLALREPLPEPPLARESARCSPANAQRPMSR
jgi:hypothetical protein